MMIGATASKRPTTRRVFIGGMVAAVGAAALLARPSQPTFFAGHDLPIGIQLVSVWPELKTDLPGTLAKLHGIGFRTVELPGFLGRTGRDLRAALDRAGLRATDIHLGGRPQLFGPGLDGDLGRLAADCHVLGCETIVVPGFYVPEARAVEPLTAATWRTGMARLSRSLSLNDWKWNADYLNRRAEALRGYGISLGFHLSNAMLAPVGDRTVFDILASETDPRLVLVRTRHRLGPVGGV